VDRFLFDALDLGHNPKGVGRVLSSVVPHLVEQAPDEIVIVCTAAGIELLDPAAQARAVEVGRPLQTRWEQWSLPRLGRKLRAAATYSHREAGAMWGPPLVLHIPEDPEVRWERTPPRTAREHARRLYNRLLIRRSITHAAVLAVSTTSVADGLRRRYGVRRRIATLPLGVDLEVFAPAARPRRDAVFHLGSSDPRDHTMLVVDAWAAARRDGPLPPLTIGGDLGELELAIRERAARLDVPLELPGRLSDGDLRDRFAHAAAVVQPSSDEGFGLQPLEAMAAGAPVVVTGADAVVEVVGDGALVADATPVDLARGMRRALDEGDVLGAAGRRRAEQFGWPACADAVLRALREAGRLR
jgi:glycosyltransferase involved in cell wall biosynthesis